METTGEGKKPGLIQNIRKFSGRQFSKVIGNSRVRHFFAGAIATTAVIFAAENRNSIADTIENTSPTMTGELLDANQIGPKTETDNNGDKVVFEPVIEANIEVCEQINENSRECTSYTILFNEQDVLDDKVRVEGRTVRFEESLVDRQRPITIYRKER